AQASLASSSSASITQRATPAKSYAASTCSNPTNGDSSSLPERDDVEDAEPLAGPEVNLLIRPDHLRVGPLLGSPGCPAPERRDDVQVPAAPRRRQRRAGEATVPRRLARQPAAC